MRINLSMTATFNKRLREEADKAGMTVSQYVRYAVIRLWEVNNDRNRTI